MKIYEYLDIDKLYIIGDIHGEFKRFFSNIKRNGLSFDENKYAEEIHPLVKEDEEAKEREGGIFSRYLHKKKPKSLAYHNSVICVCGDCGFGFNKPQYYYNILEKANELFSETNTHIIFIRGNHDDPSYFNGEMINLSNIKAVPDYSVIMTKNFNTLCVGGAISVDRTWRKQQECRINKYSKSKSKRLFWEDEAPLMNENILSFLRDNGIKINSILSHTAPSFCYPKDKDTSLNWFKIDPNLRDDLTKERKIMDWLYEEMIKEHELIFWGYGHFHTHIEEYINNITFIANSDSYNIISPETIAHRMKAKYEMEKRLSENKRKRRSKRNADEQVMSIDDMINDAIDRPTPIRRVEVNFNDEHFILNDVDNVVEDEVVPRIERENYIDNYEEMRAHLERIIFENNAVPAEEVAPF